MAYVFFDKYNLGEPYTYIHPFHQKAIKHLVEHLPEWIEVVAVFGSSVRTTCGPNSDLDICLIGQMPEQENLRQLRLPEHQYDFINVASRALLMEKAQQSFQNIYQNIVKEGVIVYDKHRLAQTSPSGLETISEAS